MTRLTIWTCVHETGLHYTQTVKCRSLWDCSNDLSSNCAQKNILKVCSHDQLTDCGWSSDRLCCIHCPHIHVQWWRTTLLLNMKVTWQLICSIQFHLPFCSIHLELWGISWTTRSVNMKQCFVSFACCILEFKLNKTIQCTVIIKINQINCTSLWVKFRWLFRNCYWSKRQPLY